MFKGLREHRPLTDEEIKEHKKIPEGATFYEDYQSYDDARMALGKRKASYQAGCNRDKGLFWTKEGV
ncbi:hypothetical protein LCGC14_0388040 [marine sediment metagenome]|uniref:Uncharacterized protein n=1 Tax=marine sediment metagenome TaxID=412755 RepID=A0A0F9TIQ4_9ZZZZ